MAEIKYGYKAIISDGAKQLLVNAIQGSVYVFAYTGEAVFGKTPDELQKDVKIVGNKIQGTLNYIEGWTEFSSKPEEQDGYFVMIQSNLPEGEKVYMSIGAKSDVELDDGIMVLRIINGKSVKLTAKKDDEIVEEKEYIFDFTLEPQPEVEGEIADATEE